MVYTEIAIYGACIKALQSLFAELYARQQKGRESLIKWWGKKSYEIWRARYNGRCGGRKRDWKRTVSLWRHVWVHQTWRVEQSWSISRVCSVAYCLYITLEMSHCTCTQIASDCSVDNSHLAKCLQWKPYFVILLDNLSPTGTRKGHSRLWRGVDW